jgi:hypothetical protein
MLINYVEIILRVSDILGISSIIWSSNDDAFNRLPVAAFWVFESSAAHAAFR